MTKVPVIPRPKPKVQADSKPDAVKPDTPAKSAPKPTADQKAAKTPKAEKVPVENASHAHGDESTEMASPQELEKALKFLPRDQLEKIDQDIESADWSGGVGPVGKVGDYDASIVDGDTLKLHHGKDMMGFVEGGNSEVYPELGPKTPWIYVDQNITPHDRPAIALHEVVEATLMKKGKYSYDDAHKVANSAEDAYRQSKGIGTQPQPDQQGQQGQDQSQDQQQGLPPGLSMGGGAGGQDQGGAPQGVDPAAMQAMMQQGGAPQGGGMPPPGAMPQGMPQGSGLPPGIDPAMLAAIMQQQGGGGMPQGMMPPGGPGR